MLLIVSDFRGTYHHLVNRLEAEGADLIELDPGRRSDRTISKLGIVRQMTTPRLLRLRGRWTADDTVLLISWYLIPVLLLIRLRVLPRPRRLVSMAAFVHAGPLRRVVNLLLRALRTRDMEFIAFSDAERRNLTDAVGVAPQRIHRVVYRGNPLDAVAAPASDGDYVFTGGYSNRDYETFFAAVRGLRRDVIAVPSALNDIRDVPPNVDLRTDVPWDEFDGLVGGCAVLVLPLRAGGEACGQNVLLRGIQHSRPVVATRHDSLIDYLGEDYPGFVPPHDVPALAAAVERAVEDESFRASLLAGVQSAGRWLQDQEPVEVEIARILTG
jgi:glycosyltransferase involved in cell wall biosynthesis